MNQIRGIIDFPESWKNLVINYYQSNEAHTVRGTARWFHKNYISHLSKSLANKYVQKTLRESNIDTSRHSCHKNKSSNDQQNRKHFSSNKAVLSDKNPHKEKRWEHTQDGSAFFYEGLQRITTLEDALKFCNADLNKFEVVDWRFNSWEVSALIKGQWSTVTNYQVKVVFSPKSEAFDWEACKNDIVDYINDNDELCKINRIRKSKGRKGIAFVADPHVGAKVNKNKFVINTPDFDIKILIDYLDRMAETINSYGLSEVHVTLLGDLVETITGLNHMSVWHGLEEDMIFGSIIIMAFKIFKSFLLKIDNLKSVDVISGNHDRMTSNKEEDVYGSTAQVLSFFLSEAIINVKFKWHPILITRIYDGVCYVQTHQHLGVSKKNLGEIFFKYGKQKYYNVMVGAHKHTRESKKSYNDANQHMKTLELIPTDSNEYRAVTIAPLFTGNFYSESIGYTSTAGFSLFMKSMFNNKNVDHHDISL